MTEPKNPENAAETESNHLSDEELEAASGGVLNLGQAKINSTVSSRQVIAPVDVAAGAVPSVKDTLL